MNKAEQQAWVDEEYAWIVDHFTGPSTGRALIKLDRASFPRTLRSDHPPAEWIIQDLCTILELEVDRIHLQFFEDSRNIYGLPLHQRDLPSQSHLVAQTNADGTLRFDLHLAASLKNKARPLLKQCILDLVAIRLAASGLSLDPTADDHLQRVELAAVFLGFGWFLAHGRNEIILEIKAGWRKTSTYRSALPHSMFARALVLDAQRKGISEKELINALPTEIRHDVHEALKPIPPPAPKTTEQLLREETGALFRDGHRLLKKGEFTPAIQAMITALEQEDRPKQRALLLHNIGYACSLSGQFNEAITHLEAAIHLNPEQRYAHDNLGFALIMNDDLEAGKASLEQALTTRGSHPGYSHRNMAVYLWKKGNLKAAGDEFRKAFEARGPVDLLNALYSRFLSTQGESEIAALHEEAAMNESPGIPEWIKNIEAAH